MAPNCTLSILKHNPHALNYRADMFEPDGIPISGDMISMLRCIPEEDHAEYILGL